MDPYNPDIPPNPRDWQSGDEDARLTAVIGYHRREKITVANERLHAAIHVVVENQVALGETIVIDTLARLQREGLTRHDAIHAVGAVLVERIVAALKNKTTPDGLASGYLEDLKALTAEAWQKSE